MKILLLGNGGREHALKNHLESHGHSVFMDGAGDFVHIYQRCHELGVDVMLPSSEAHLCQGIVNFADLTPARESVPLVFGPTAAQAKIEGSKVYAKQLMNELDIPTANYKMSNDTINNPEQYVIKYSGLAKGKGVFIPTRESYEHDLAQAQALGPEKVILEEKLTGREVSVLAFCNGTSAYLMPQVQDYKRLYDGDEGPNTGGMGAVCPVHTLTEKELEVVQTCMNRVVSHLGYVGVLYAGIMSTENGPYFLEFNCRFGDPETQVLMSQLDTDLVSIIKICMAGGVPKIQWKSGYSVGVVMSHIDYPESRVAPVSINYRIVPPNVALTHQPETTTGGRVLTAVSRGQTVHLAAENVYNYLRHVSYQGVYYRYDIGRGLDRLCSLDTADVAVAILTSGGVHGLELLLEQTTHVKLIVTETPTPDVLALAQKHFIPLTCDSMCSSDRLVNILRSYEIEFLVMSGYDGDIITPEMLWEFTVISTSVAKTSAGEVCTVHRWGADKRILLQEQIRAPDPELESRCLLDYVNIYAGLPLKYDVDIDEGNAFVEDLKRDLSGIGDFCAKYVWPDGNGTQSIIAASADGCGTKLDLANQYGALDTIGIDLVAMNVNDLYAGGAVPLFFMDYIAIDSMDKDTCGQIITGIREGCRQANCQLVGGETAEMKGIYMSGKLDLAGFAVGTLRHTYPEMDRTKTYTLYGIPSSGIHSNGYTLVKKLLDRGYAGTGVVRDNRLSQILIPTRIYHEVPELCRTYPNNIYGVAHITGGGFRDNITRILPEGMTFRLRHWKFPEIFQWIQKHAKVSREYMLTVFNCGYGMVIISDTELPYPVIGDINASGTLEMS